MKKHLEAEETVNLEVNTSLEVVVLEWLTLSDDKTNREKSTPAKPFLSLWLLSASSEWTMSYEDSICKLKHNEKG